MEEEQKFYIVKVEPCKIRQGTTIDINYKNGEFYYVGKKGDLMQEEEKQHRLKLKLNITWTQGHYTNAVFKAEMNYDRELKTNEVLQSIANEDINLQMWIRKRLVAAPDSAFYGLTWQTIKERLVAHYHEVLSGYYVAMHSSWDTQVQRIEQDFREMTQITERDTKEGNE